MAHAVFAGSFDPPTFGHLDIIARASSIFETLHVVVAANRNKRGLFEPEERAQLLTASIDAMTNVFVVVWDGLVVDYARNAGCTILVRGVRGITDFASEYDMAILNSQLEPTIETFLICADPRYSTLSSSAVKEFAHFRRDISALVPSPVLKALADRRP